MKRSNPVLLRLNQHEKAAGQKDYRFQTIPVLGYYDLCAQLFPLVKVHYDVSSRIPYVKSLDWTKQLDFLRTQSQWFIQCMICAQYVEAKDIKYEEKGIPIICSACLTGGGVDQRRFCPRSLTVYIPNAALNNRACCGRCNMHEYLNRIDGESSSDDEILVRNR